MVRVDVWELFLSQISHQNWYSFVDFKDWSRTSLGWTNYKVRAFSGRKTASLFATEDSRGLCFCLTLPGHLYSPSTTACSTMSKPKYKVQITKAHIHIWVFRIGHLSIASHECVAVLSVRWSGSSLQVQRPGSEQSDCLTTRFISP